jgi:hypothetical protein
MGPKLRGARARLSSPSRALGGPRCSTDVGDWQQERIHYLLTFLRAGNLTHSQTTLLEGEAVAFFREGGPPGCPLLPSALLLLPHPAPCLQITAPPSPPPPGPLHLLFPRTDCLSGWAAKKPTPVSGLCQRLITLGNSTKLDSVGAGRGWGGWGAVKRKD